jgi:hypothetical protein
MGLAICNLLASLRTDNAQDYVYLSYFLICELPRVKIMLCSDPWVKIRLWP